MWPRENKCQLQEKKSQPDLPGADILSLRAFSCLVILSEAKNLEKKGGTTDREQGNFALCCVSVDYKKLVFAVRRASLHTGHRSVRDSKVKKR